MIQSHKRCAGFEESDRASTSGAQIENALDVLLKKLLAERKRQREAPGQKPPLRAFSAAELAEMPILSDREIRQERIIEDPVAGAFELAIREIGEVRSVSARWRRAHGRCARARSVPPPKILRTSRQPGRSQVGWDRRKVALLIKSANTEVEQMTTQEAQVEQTENGSERLRRLRQPQMMVVFEGDAAPPG